MPSPLVLVVDDSRSALLVICSMLEDDGIRVACAHGGREALALLEREVPALVVLDILMPDLDGFETCRRLRALEHFQDVPVLFLTGGESLDLQTKAIAAGGDDLIHKSAMGRELLIRVRSLLRVSALQKELRAQRDAARQAKTDREHLFRFIIHDLKGPLQIIRSSVEMMAEGQGGEEVAQGRGRIGLMVERMVRMIQDLLDVMQEESHGLKPQLELIPLAACLEQWADDLGAALLGRGQVLELLCELPGPVASDLELLRRILFNLVDNATKYSPWGSRIGLEARLDPDGLVIQVADEGAGIPEEAREAIFEPFVRLDRDAQQTRSSSGLGLAFCRMAAQALGGSLQVAARAPRGSTFILSLPQQQGPAAGLCPESDPKQEG